jgi:hypothetical protein
MIVCTTNPKNERLFIDMVQMGSIFHGRGHMGIKINDHVGQNF